MIKIIVLISADAEWKVITALHEDCEIQKSPLGDYFLTSVIVNGNAKSVLFYHGGWGKISAAATTQYVIQRWNPQLIINLGTCGGFADKVNKHDIILVNKTVVYDICERAGNNEEHIKHYTTELDLAWLKEPLPHHHHKAVIVSADQDLDGKIIPELIEKYDAVAADWESAAIAYVCKKNKVKGLIVRGVSDLVDKTGSIIYEDEISYIKGTEIVMKKLVEALPDWIANEVTSC